LRLVLLSQQPDVNAPRQRLSLPASRTAAPFQRRPPLIADGRIKRAARQVALTAVPGILLLAAVFIIRQLAWR